MALAALLLRQSLLRHRRGLVPAAGRGDSGELRGGHPVLRHRFDRRTLRRRSSLHGARRDLAGVERRRGARDLPHGAHAPSCPGKDEGLRNAENGGESRKDNGEGRQDPRKAGRRTRPRKRQPPGNQPRRAGRRPRNRPQEKPESHGAAGPDEEKNDEISNDKPGRTKDCDGTAPFPGRKGHREGPDPEARQTRAERIGAGAGGITTNYSI